MSEAPHHDWDASKPMGRDLAMITRNGDSFRDTSCPRYHNGPFGGWNTHAPVPRDRAAQDWNAESGFSEQNLLPTYIAPNNTYRNADWLPNRGGGHDLQELNGSLVRPTQVPQTARTAHSWNASDSTGRNTSSLESTNLPYATGNDVTARSLLNSAHTIHHPGPGSAANVVPWTSHSMGDVSNPVYPPMRNSPSHRLDPTSSFPSEHGFGSRLSPRNEGIPIPSPSVLCLSNGNELRDQQSHLLTNPTSSYPYSQHHREQLTLALNNSQHLCPSAVNDSSTSTVNLRQPRHQAQSSIHRRLAAGHTSQFQGSVGGPVSNAAKCFERPSTSSLSRTYSSTAVPGRSITTNRRTGAEPLLRDSECWDIIIPMHRLELILAPQPKGYISGKWTQISPNADYLDELQKKYPSIPLPVFNAMIPPFDSHQMRCPFDKECDARLAGPSHDGLLSNMRNHLSSDHPNQMNSNSIVCQLCNKEMLRSSIAKHVVDCHCQARVCYCRACGQKQSRPENHFSRHLTTCNVLKPFSA